MRLGALDFRSNSIGFLRLLFAAVVIWSHAYALGGFGLDPIGRLTGGTFSAGLLAVCGFFVVSGFLITRSFERSTGVGRYLWHRVLRIFPGYWVCLLAVAFAFAPAIYWGQHYTLRGFLDSSESPVSFVIRNAGLQLKQLNVSGPFPSLAFPIGINGSLWTLWYEFLCYLAVAALGLAGIFARKKPMVVVAAATLYALFVVLPLIAGSATLFGTQLLCLIVSFALGSTAYVYRNAIPIGYWQVFAAAVALALSMRIPVAFSLVLPATLSYLTLFCAMKLPFKRVDRYFDLSYGVYIYAFPIQQLFAMYGVNRWGLAPYVFSALIAACAVAAVSWFAVERPALKLKELRVQLNAGLRRRAVRGGE